MKRTAFLFAALLLFAPETFAQLDPQLRADVRETGFIHRPLPVREDKSFEQAAALKPALTSELLCDMESLEGWSHQGYGSISLTSERCREGKYSLRLEGPSMPEKFLDWGIGRGTAMATYDIGGKDWRNYNRIRFSIFPSCEGARTVYLNLYLENDGLVKVPDEYGREGFHEINLKNNQWNDCFLEFDGLDRDKVTCLKFAIEIFGRELTMGDTLRFDIDQVLLEKIADPEPVCSWEPGRNRIIFSTSGYTPEAGKSAIIHVDGNPDTFFVRNAASGAVAFTGQVQTEKTRIGTFRTADFTALRTPGQYYLEAGGVKTYPFYIHRDVWEDSAWRLVNFLFVERCGYPVPGKHGACHTDLHAVHEGRAYPLNGGWHDAGDMSQQTPQSAEIAYSLMQMAQTALGKGHMDLYNRLMEEALWGMDFVLRSRLGGGYRAMSWGTNLWTDRALFTEDDAGRRENRVHNGALENFLFAGVEAYAAMVVQNDPELTGNLVKVAQEDFAFAKERYDQYGYEELRMTGNRGHLSMTSESQYHASISWSASMLYKLTGKPEYAAFAAEAISYTLACQETTPVAGLSGYFYRNLKKTGIVHFNHQSRDYAFAEALALLMETQPEHPDYAAWKNSLTLIGRYLKGLMPYVAPYGMVPSGVYLRGEADDTEEFRSWQIWVNDDKKADFLEQLENGVKLDKTHYLRAFPVWFSFKGNTAVSLATGKAAAICARVLQDPELKDIAERQLSWVVGYNPFGQSLIYGEGSNWCQLYNALPGETVGEIPVGMQSRYNGDTPYWPQFNTATYKEVWGGTAVKWLMLVAEF